MKCVKGATSKPDLSASRGLPNSPVQIQHFGDFSKLNIQTYFCFNINKMCWNVFEAKKQTKNVSNCTDFNIWEVKPRCVGNALFRLGTGQTSRLRNVDPNQAAEEEEEYRWRSGCAVGGRKRKTPSGNRKPAPTRPCDGCTKKNPTL